MIFRRTSLAIFPELIHNLFCFQLLYINGLVKRFQDFEAVSGLNLVIEKNTIYGLLGFNGAGNQCER